MTYTEYLAYGGTCPENQFPASLMDATIRLKKLEETYAVKYPTPETRDFVLVKLTDLAFEDVQTKGGTMLSMKAGSYSEQRRSVAESERRNRPFFILKDYADVSARPIGVIK